mmetsp:Transcript_14415/g.43668  ORF Transcript_14415/g.43668 Transcript_14415/m.43668 type:complete len:201 (-) Transcript_14415:304-906(-)
MGRPSDVIATFKLRRSNNGCPQECGRRNLRSCRRSYRSRPRSTTRVPYSPVRLHPSKWCRYHQTSTMTTCESGSRSTRVSSASASLGTLRRRTASLTSPAVLKPSPLRSTPTVAPSLLTLTSVVSRASSESVPSQKATVITIPAGFPGVSTTALPLARPGMPSVSNLPKFRSLLSFVIIVVVFLFCITLPFEIEIRRPSS